jgi:hypothetical protein
MKIMLVEKSDPIDYGAQSLDSSISFPNFFLPSQSAHLSEGDKLS